MPWRRSKGSSNEGRPHVAAHGRPAERKSLTDESLWHEAYVELRERNHDLVSAFEKILGSSSTSGALALSPENVERYAPTEAQLSQLVDEKLTYMNERQWRISLGKQSIEVRTQVDRILKIITVAKDFGSSLASLDPIHAGLPWAGVCVLLPVGSPREAHFRILTPSR